MPDIDQSQLVDLDQIAALAMLSKRTLQEYVRQMPPPYRRGRGRAAAVWLWQEVRPWLAEKFEMPRLPKLIPRH